MATAQPTGEPRNFPEDESMDPVESERVVSPEPLDP